MTGRIILSHLTALQNDGGSEGGSWFGLAKRFDRTDRTRSLRAYIGLLSPISSSRDRASYLMYSSYSLKV